MAELIIKNAKEVNGAKLTAELQAAGAADSVTPNGDTLYIHNVTDEAQAQAIYEAHDPTPVPQTEIKFELPVQAPVFIAEDFRVQSPKVPNDRKKALADAVAEGKKKDKSVAFVALATAHYLEDLELRVAALEAEIAKGKPVK